jgi:hypothetical protein
MAKDAKQLPPELKGIWINRAILTNSGLSLAEKFIVAEVDALTTDKGPCKASNAHFAALIGFSLGGIHNLLTEMQKDGKLIQLGFHRTFRERVVNPAFSEHPEIVQKWTAKQSRTHLGISPSTHLGISAEESRTHPEMSRGLTCGLVEDSPVGEREVPSEKTIEKTSSSLASSGGGTVSGSATDTGIDDDAIFESNGDGKEEEAIALLKLLTEERVVTRKVALQLIKEFPANRIFDYVDDFDFRRRQGEEHTTGYLIESIRNGYEFHPDFKTRAQKAEKKAREDEKEARRERERQQLDKEAEDNKRANELLAKQTPAEREARDKKLGITAETPCFEASWLRRHDAKIELGILAGDEPIPSIFSQRRESIVAGEPDEVIPAVLDGRRV